MRITARLLILTLLGLVFLTGCSGGGSGATQTNFTPTPTPGASPSPTPAATPTPTPAPITLTSLQVTPGTIAIGTGAKQQFTALGKFSDNSTKDMTASVAWSSSDSAIASIDGTGLATGVVSGSVTVTAKSGTIQGTAGLSVTVAAANLTTISITPAASSIPVNTTQQFTATGTYSDGSSRDLSALVTWGSSATSVATIDANGLVSAISAGPTTISATLGAVTGNTGLTVTTPVISFLTVSPDGLTLGAGVKQQFTATATYSDGSSQDLSSGVTWSTSDNTLATVNSTGLVTTVAAGTITITATLGSINDSATLTVVPAKLLSISVSPSNPSIALGTTEQFTATGNFDDGSTQQLTSVTWSSSDVNVATINASGLATSTGTGPATITATSGSVSGSASLTVTSAALVSIVVTPNPASMAIGTTQQFTATGTFSDNSTQDVTASVLWSSSSPTVATINNQGVASSVAIGTTTITATFGAVSGPATLNVSNAHLISITISPANPKIQLHTLIRFTASGTFSDNSVATNLSGLSWKSNHPNIASIRSNGVANGKKLGPVTITASASGVAGTTTLTVSNATLSSLAITPVNPSVTLGTPQQFTATGTFSDNSTQDVTLNTHWSSSSSGVATVANGPGSAGLATTVGKGSTAIGANSGGVIAPATTLTVK
ncbi:MAG TPA: Ig-like domain-containing protein [Candidatus Limnocylindrales bacterium]|nr:Ig-like domain-containing protein [Candidatus Limnocylindrales bacterium]